MSYFNSDLETYGPGEESCQTKSNQEILTHDLSDGHRLSQCGGSTGPSHVVGPHTKLKLVPRRQVSHD